VHCIRDWYDALMGDIVLAYLDVLTGYGSFAIQTGGQQDALRLK
jgi:hypothetical protein